MLFSEPKIPQSRARTDARSNSATVSVLFSEPKIPQYFRISRATGAAERFSALQRAENSSITIRLAAWLYRQRFQCSSASRKFLNNWWYSPSVMSPTGFSALQRAENSSIDADYMIEYIQPSSFSALQRAENSSIDRHHSDVGFRVAVSVLFSEPKIPQCVSSSDCGRGVAVSVLFSEPKIPQFFRTLWKHCVIISFSALQRAENSSIRLGLATRPACGLCFSALQRAENSSMLDAVLRFRVGKIAFQCSSASRKFLNCTVAAIDRVEQIRFQCSSASRKFLNQRTATSAMGGIGVSVLFSEPKIPQSALTVSL